MAGLPDSEDAFSFLDKEGWDEVNKLVDTPVSATHQMNSVPYQSFNPMPPSPYTEFQNPSFSMTGNFNPETMTSANQIVPSPYQHVIQPIPSSTSTSNTNGIRRSNIRHGCKLCPGIHFDREQSNLTSDSNKGVEGHFILKHPDLVNDWKSYVYKWGYQVTYHDGSIEDEPDEGSAESAMTTFGPKGGTYGRKEIESRGETGVGVGGDRAGEVQVIVNHCWTEDVNVQKYDYGYDYTDLNNDTNAYHINGYTGSYTNGYAPVSAGLDTNTNYNTVTNNDDEGVKTEDDIMNHLHPALFIDNQNSQGYYY